MPDRVRLVVMASAPTETDRRALLDRLRETTELLESIAVDRNVLAGVPDEERGRLLRAIELVNNPDSRTLRRLAKATKRQKRIARINKEDEALHETGIRTLRRKPVFTTPNVFPPHGFAPADLHDNATENGPEIRETIEPQHCYVCKQKYTVIHHFYDQLCPDCAQFNFRKRTELADLRGRVALVTGGRVKIGYQAGLKLLRAGAHVIVTTRFPRDSAQRYAREADFGEWAHRLEIFGLDLRHTPSVEAFCRELLATCTRLDFIVNNACQTVRRPPDFYRHMMEGERAALPSMPDDVRKLVGSYEGLRGYSMLPEDRSDRSDRSSGSDRSVAGLTHSAQLSQVPLLPEE